MTIPPAMPWVKLHTSYLEDSRFIRLDESQGYRFFQLLMLAGKLDAGGYFTEHGQELTEKDIAWKLHLQVESLRSDLRALSKVGLTHKNGRGWCITGFEDEQGPTQKDKRAAWKDRQKKHRECHDDVTSDNSVTHLIVTPTEEEEEIEVEKEEEEEEKRTPPAASLFLEVSDSRLPAPSLDLSIPAAIPDLSQESQEHNPSFSSETNKAEITVSLTGYTKFPENPAEAANDPIIGIFRDVTERLPGVSQYKAVIETIIYIRKNKTRELQSVVDYLKPYWLAWSNRRSQTGKPYSPSNLTWLTEWAVNASIPTVGGDKSTNTISHIPTVEETKKRLDEQSKVTYTPPPQEVLAKLGSLTKSMTKKR